ncbi:MAG TPA: zf-HC2 domain-containing protein [Acidobacteriota bacterium]|nr:zf-HC2 domain-containing protein [Acidobacteriota bacterium]
MGPDEHHGENHGRCLESLIEVFLYIDGQLDEKRSSEIDYHLQHCSKCYGRVEFEKLLRGYVQKKSREEGPSPSLSAKINNIFQSK